MRWLAFILGVVMFNFIRLVTDLPGTMISGHILKCNTYRHFA